MPATYKIGEVASKLDLRTYVLRFWETEFPQVVPLRTEKGQRLYTQEHIDLLSRIKYLLHERGMTIEGARKELNATPSHQQSPQEQPSLLQSFDAPAKTEKAPTRKNQEESAAEHYVRMLIDGTDIPESGPVSPATPAAEKHHTSEEPQPPDPLLHDPQLMHDLLTELESIATLLRS